MMLVMKNKIDRKREKIAKKERAENRFAKCDIWNFFLANAEAQVYALTALRDMAHGYPDCEEIPTMEKWKQVLDAMIDGWQAMVDYDNSDFWETPEEWKAHTDACMARFNLGTSLYVKYYTSLWD